jgi:uncharacterized membrane protein YfcA
MDVAAIFAAGALSGFVDAIAGGGALVMIPALLLSGLPAAGAIATNKVVGVVGVTTSALRYGTRGLVDRAACLWMGPPAAVGSLLGSRSIGLLPRAWAEPVVIVLLVAITAFVLVTPRFGADAAAAAPAPLDGPRRAKLALAGAAIGFHDGFFGPGAGTFLVFALVSLGGLDFLRATGTAKLVNLMANSVALVSFLLMGAVDLRRGLLGAAGVVLGSYAGASLAARRGARVVRPVFVAVTALLLGRLVHDYLTR